VQAPSGSPALILVPTALELRELAALSGATSTFGTGLGLVEVCGFGPLAAAARAGTLLERLRPARVLLIGIAGSYDAARASPGTAHVASSVASDGIGAGEGLAHVGPAELGFAQWDAPRAPDRRDGPGRVRIVDRLGLGWAHADALLVSACAASADAQDATRRRERHPGALLEDMEGFGVAFACALAGVPCQIVRGVSNVAGDRERARWKLREALAAARTLALQLLQAAPPEPPCAA
jgi:futalosine hydrolase